MENEINKEQTDNLKKKKQEINKFGANAEKFIDGIRNLLERIEKIEGKLERHYYYHKKRDISPSSQGFDSDKDEIFGE